MSDKPRIKKVTLQASPDFRYSYWVSVSNCLVGIGNTPCDAYADYLKRFNARQQLYYMINKTVDDLWR